MSAFAARRSQSRIRVVHPCSVPANHSMMQIFLRGESCAEIRPLLIFSSAVEIVPLTNDNNYFLIGVIG